jgi:hypothetical protein
MTAAGAPADVQLQMQLYLDQPSDGRRAARVAIVARPGPGGATLVREFRTSLSDPVDDEQWRVLGEGAAYRLIGELSAVRIVRPALRAAQSLRTMGQTQGKALPQPALDKSVPPVFDGGRLGLRLDLELVSE